MDTLLQPAAAPLPKLTRFEIAVHGVADGISVYVLLDSLLDLRGGTDLIPSCVALLVILLSVVVTVQRFRPGVRGLRRMEIGLSGLLVLLGLFGAVMTLVVLTSGATYKGTSPDAGGMAVMAGFLVYFPAAGLLVLPFVLNDSRLSSRLRRRVWRLILMLALLPFSILVGIQLVR